MSTNLEIYVYIVIATIFRTHNFITLPFVFVTRLYIVFSFEEYMVVRSLLLKTDTWCSFYDIQSTRPLHFTCSIKQIIDISIGTMKLPRVSIKSGK